MDRKTAMVNPGEDTTLLGSGVYRLTTAWTPLWMYLPIVRR